MRLFSVLMSVVLVSVAHAQDPTTFKVTFNITVPPTTAEDALVFIAGGHPALGNWAADGLQAERQDDGSYIAITSLPAGNYEFKTTLGTWATVEKTADGRNIDNRKFTVKKATTVDVVIKLFGAGEPLKPKEPTITGTVEFHREFKSKYLLPSRDIAVYLPPGYDATSSKRYPVLYMHDGQNLFDANTSTFGVEWQADETAQRLIEAGRIEPLIIVGIYNSRERTDEYTPGRDQNRKAGGKGERYAKMLIEEVIPFIESAYRVDASRSARGIGGSSLGGLISLYICQQYPETFSRCLVVSPALWWNDHAVVKSLKSDNAGLKNLRIWLDMGTKEGRQIDEFTTAIRDTRALVKVFEAAGMQAEKDFKYVEIEGGEHNEASWAQRFGDMLEFAYGKE